MSISPILKVVAGWFFGGLIAGGVFIYITRPMAGLTLLTLMMMSVTMFVTPIVHIVVTKYQAHNGNNNSGVVVAILISVLLMLGFGLVASGIFNFTWIILVCAKRALTNACIRESVRVAGTFPLIRSVRGHIYMADYPFHKKAPRTFEIVTGIILAIISLLFLVMFLYYPIAIYRNNILSIGTVLAEVVLGFIGIGLPILSYRLITGKGAKDKKSLFSVHVLVFFGLFFGVASVVMLGVGIFISDIKLILICPFGLVMAYSIVKLGAKRKSRTDES
jgi:hypothetical protein